MDRHLMELATRQVFPLDHIEHCSRCFQLSKYRTAMMECIPE